MKYLILFFLTYLSFFVNAQEIYGIEEWKFHFPYNKPTLLTGADNRIYVATENSIFFFDKDDNNLQKLTKQDGLSDIEISAIKYSKEHKTLLVAYKSGIIDLVINEQTFVRIDDIFRANIIGSKQINHIFFKEEIAYLSTDFGLIQLDIIKYEIKDSYRNIGENGKQLTVFESTINSLSNEIFIITEEGLKKGSTKNTVNLLDFNNWILEKDPTEEVTHICTLNNVTYSFSKKDNTVNYFSNNKWITIDSANTLLKGQNITSFHLNEESNSILASFNNHLFEMKDTNSVQKIDTYVWDSQNIIIDSEGFFWINTSTEGVTSNYFGELKSIYPDGPIEIDVAKFYNDGEKEYVLRGGYQYAYVAPNWKGSQFYIYDNQKWSNDKTEKGIGLCDMVINPANNYTYFASFGGGLITKSPDGIYEEFKEGTKDIPLKGVNRIPTVELDNNNNVWLTSFLTGGEPSLYKIDKDNTWTAYTINHQYADVFIDITIDDFNLKWLRIKGSSNRNGIYVFDERINKGRYLSNNFSSGNLPSEIINDVKKDRENRIWIATNNGVALFDNQSFQTNNLTSSEVLNNDIQCRLPIVTEQGLPMLLGEVVTCIAVDGANRKWFGTNSGLWLFNENGTIVLKKFDTKNSPLPSNEITTLDINPKTGELFIGTNFGIITYWDGTTVAEPEPKDELKIFPNPVKIGQNQSITIQGLAESVTVKITDITGRIIVEKKALGGTVIWNGYNVNSQVAKSGIYLIYSVTEDGEEGFVGKFALIE